MQPAISVPSLNGSFSESTSTNRSTTCSSRNSSKSSRFVQRQSQRIQDMHIVIFPRNTGLEIQRRRRPLLGQSSALLVPRGFGSRSPMHVSVLCRCRPCQSHSLAVNAGAHALIPAELFPVAQRLVIHISVCFVQCSSK